MKKFPDNHKLEECTREMLLNMAVESYRFFYPTISLKASYEMMFNELNTDFNKDLYVQETTPTITAMTLNSDTPYGLAFLSTKETGPLVIEIPAGPIIGSINNVNYRYVSDVGIIGEDKGKGGKYLVLPPDFKDEIPEGYFVLEPNSYITLLASRVVPKELTVKDGIELINDIKIYPLNEKDNPSKNNYHDISNKELWLSPVVVWEGKYIFWEKLKEVIDYDIPDKEFYPMYGLLKELGIEKGKIFNPTDEIKSILTEAAKKGNNQMFACSFGNTNPEKIVWENKKWEWVVFGNEPDKYFYFDNYMDVALRTRWYYQAVLETPAMFAKKPNSGSIYYLGYKDGNNMYLDGSSTYKLQVKIPVPAELFWSITVYDLETRSEIKTDQNNAVISSLFDIKEDDNDSQNHVDLYFGPEKPKNAKFWKKTNKDRDWFAYFRIYGPKEDVFNNKWILNDFKKII